MFKDALLDSSPRQRSVLCRIHYLFSVFTGTLAFALGLYSLPLLLAPAIERAVLLMAAMTGVIFALSALMLCYVWADTQQQHLAVWPWLGVTLVLNLPGFLIYLVYSAQKTGDWKRAAIPLAYVAESMFVGVLSLVPLIYTQGLPRQWLIIGIHIPPPPGPPLARSPRSPSPPPPHNHAAVNPLTAPITIPVGIVPVVEAPMPPQPEVGPAGLYVPGSLSTPGKWSDTVMAGAPWGKELPPPPPQPHSAPQRQLYCVGGNVIAARALFQPPPVYPQLALIAHIQGTVVLQAIIGKDGAVQNLEALSGPPLLMRAALNAVKTWRYQPTLLNSEPVDVLTEIDVNFKLGD